MWLATAYYYRSRTRATYAVHDLRLRRLATIAEGDGLSAVWAGIAFAEVFGVQGNDEVAVAVDSTTSAAEEVMDQYEIFLR